MSSSQLLAFACTSNAKPNPIMRNNIIKSLLLTPLCTLLFVACSQAEDAKPYPLTTCIVSGEKLGEMGKPFVFVKDGQEIKFCCKNCLKDFNKDPEKFLKEIAEKAKASQTKGS